MSEEHTPESVVEQPAPDWERELLTRLASEALRERRRARRWGIFFKFCLLAYGIGIAVLYVPRDLFGGPGGPHTAVVDVKGVIGADSAASAERVVAGLRHAFENENTKGVILRINSPGGSPVQADLINQAAGRLRKEHPDVPLYAVITDIGASGGYYVAVGADRIYANKGSIVGSIGVLMNGFGFVAGMRKLGVERRLLTAGEHKGILDPFSPTNAEDVAYMKGLLEQVHQQFIAAVQRGRGQRLSGTPELFSGLFWTGEEGVRLGLVDALGSVASVAREVIGAKKIVDYTVKPGLVERISRRLGSAVAGALLSGLRGAML